MIDFHNKFSKYNLLKIILLLTSFISLNSCRSFKGITIEKRKYNKGFYFSRVKIGSNVNTYHKQKMRDIKISEQYSTEVSKSSIVKLEENNAPYVKASSLKENRLFENRKIGQMENKSLSLTNLKITEDGVKNSERALYWLFIVLGFLVVLGVEIVLKPSSAIVGILIAIAILAFLILIYKLLSKDKQGGKIGMKPYKTILIF